MEEAALPALSPGDKSACERPVEELEIAVVTDHHRTARATGRAVRCARDVSGWGVGRTGTKTVALVRR
jgi:hypothetical protein